MSGQAFHDADGASAADHSIYVDMDTTGATGRRWQQRHRLPTPAPETGAAP
jgi:hypothetical protein